MKKDLIPLLIHEGEILIARLQSKGALKETEIQHLIQENDLAKRMDKLIHMFATRDVISYQLFIEAIEENGDRKAAQILKAAAANELFPDKRNTGETNKNVGLLTGILNLYLFQTLFKSRLLTVGLGFSEIFLRQIISFNPYIS